VLVIDDDHPGEVLIEGEPVRLQEMQYRLIRALATRPGACVAYDDIYTQVWGDTVVESNQMHFQKRNLLKRITEVHPHHEKLITTTPKRGFTLQLTPEEVVLAPAHAVSAA
jgi:DNA-binding winged helix-turn-helix (wHTH) protein